MDDLYEMPEIQAAMDSHIKKAVDSFVEKLVDLRKRELSKSGVHTEPGTHEAGEAGVPPHTEPGNHEQFAISRVQSSPTDPVGSAQQPVERDADMNNVTDPCPTCGHEDIPGECTCLSGMAKGEGPFALGADGLAKTFAWDRDPKQAKRVEGKKRKGNWGVAEKVKEKLEDKKKPLKKDGTDLTSGQLAQPEGTTASSGLAASELEHAGKPEDTEQNSGKTKMGKAEPLCKLCKGAVLCKTHLKSEPVKKSAGIVGQKVITAPASPGIIGMPKINGDKSPGVVGMPKLTPPASSGVIGNPKFTAPASVGIVGAPKINGEASAGIVGQPKTTGSVQKGEVFFDPKHADDQEKHQKEAVKHQKGKLPLDKPSEEMSSDSEEMSEEGSSGGEETSASDRGHEESSDSGYEESSDMNKSGLQKVAPPGFSEKTMHELKAKHGTESAFKIAWAAHNKKTGKSESSGIDWKKSESGNMHGVIGEHRYRIAKSSDGFAAYHNGSKLCDMKKSEDALAKANEHFSRRQVIEKAFYKSTIPPARGIKESKYPDHYDPKPRNLKPYVEPPLDHENPKNSKKKSKPVKKAAPGEISHAPNEISPDATDAQNQSLLNGTYKPPPFSPPPAPSQQSSSVGPIVRPGIGKSEGMKKSLPGKQMMQHAMSGEYLDYGQCAW